jgi:O-glycosyl hydrolase
VWRPNVPIVGEYSIYVFLPQGKADRSKNAQFSIVTNFGSQTYTVDESLANGQWLLLDTMVFSPDSSPYVQLTDAGNGGFVVADAVKFTQSRPIATSSFNITTVSKQIIKGLGVEIQSDTINSGNNGMPASAPAVPGDLIQSERERLYQDMLKGFRYARLAMGLFYRGQTPDKKNFVEAYPLQNHYLAELIERSGMEGVAMEYWSPATYWKTNHWLTNAVAGNTVANTSDPAVMTDFGNHLIQDILNLKSNHIPVVMWGLQNEPTHSEPYSSCVYDSWQYYNTFKVVAPLIRAAFPSIYIHANSDTGGQHSGGATAVREDPETLTLVDGWSHHEIGTNSKDMQRRAASYYNHKLEGKDVFNN